MAPESSTLKPSTLVILILSKNFGFYTGVVLTKTKYDV